MPANEHAGGGRRAGGSITSRPAPIPGLESRGNVLPWAGRGDIQGHHQKTTEPDHRHITPALNLGAPTKLVGGPDWIPGPISHSDWGPQS